MVAGAHTGQLPMAIEAVRGDHVTATTVDTAPLTWQIDDSVPRKRSLILSDRGNVSDSWNMSEKETIPLAGIASLIGDSTLTSDRGMTVIRTEATARELQRRF